MSAILGLIMAVLASTGLVGPSQGTLAACPGTVVTVHGDDPVGCDVQPPQRLDVTGVTVAQCDDMGGEPIALSPGGELTCEGVDV